MKLTQRIACPHCDLLIDVPFRIESNKILSCSRCHSVVAKGQKNSVERTLAFTLAAMLFLGMALPFSFLEMKAAGFFNEIYIADIFKILRHQGFNVLAIFSFTTVVILPAIYLICMLLLILPTFFNVPRFYPITVARILTIANHWSMAEVFTLGVFVGLVKLLGYAEVILGVGFFCYMAFIICFLNVVSIADNIRVWRWAEGKPTGDTEVISE